MGVHAVVGVLESEEFVRFYVCVYMCASALGGQKRASDSPGGGVTGGSKLPALGAGN